MASLATACAAVAGSVIVTTGQDDHGPVAGKSPAPTPVDARSFLLASATTAERAPAQPGRFWYTRVRTESTQNYRVDLRSAGKIKLPFSYRTTRTDESWAARRSPDRSRDNWGAVTQTFPSRKDEAAWIQAGSEPLVREAQRRPRVNVYGAERRSIATTQLTVDALLRLPTDADRLSAQLRRMFKAGGASMAPQKPGSYPYFVWSTANDLLSGPISPGTRAALYRVLADQPGVRSAGTVTDRAGRRGVAVFLPVQGFDYSAVGGQDRLIIDPKTAELLAYEHEQRAADGQPVFSQTYEAMGWVDRSGARP
jgi:hypothetical protein